MEDIQIIIEKIYRDYNPDKISSVPNLLAKYKGMETEMLSKIAEKYNLYLERYISVDYLQLVTAILKMHDPANVPNAGNLLDSFRGRETELLQTLRSKFNDGFNPLIISIYANASNKGVLHEVIESVTSVPLKTEPLAVVKPAGKNSKSLIFGIIGIVAVIVILVVLYMSGVFKSGTAHQNSSNSTNLSKDPNTNVKTNNNDNLPPSSSVEERNIEGPINVMSVSASSFMKSNGRISFSPGNVSDHNLQTWWSPSPPHSDGVNSWLTIEFGQSRKVSAIEILNGSHYLNYPKYGNLYFKNNRILKARLEFSNGNSQIIELREVDEVQKISFPMQNTSCVKIIPLSWGNGSQWNDLCISEFTAIGE